MSSFAVFHITKFKALVRIGSHIDRQHAPRNADKRRTPLNEELSSEASMLPLHQAIEKRIASGYTHAKALRKDAVKALGIIFSGSHERMKEIEADAELFQAWKKANLAFARSVFGSENIVRFTLHRDEKTPHFHCVVVPITPGGGLSARYYVNGSRTLSSYQDRYAQAMAPFGLYRGISSHYTFKRHKPTGAYYRQENQGVAPGPDRGASWLSRLGLDPHLATQGLTPPLEIQGRSISWPLYAFSSGSACHRLNTYTVFEKASGGLQGYFHKGRGRGLAVLFPEGGYQRVVLTESPLEALYQRSLLSRQDARSVARTLYVSTCGPPSASQLRQLDPLLLHVASKGLGFDLYVPASSHGVYKERLAAFRSHGAALRFKRPSFQPLTSLFGTLSQLPGPTSAKGEEEEKEEKEGKPPRHVKACL